MLPIPARAGVKMLAENAMNDKRYDNTILKKVIKQPTKTPHIIQVSVNVIRDVEQMKDILDFEVGTHGLHVTLSDNTGKSQPLTAIFLPEVAKQNGWTNRETIANLIINAGVRL